MASEDYDLLTLKGNEVIEFQDKLCKILTENDWWSIFLFMKVEKSEIDAITEDETTVKQRILKLISLLFRRKELPFKEIKAALKNYKLNKSIDELEQILFCPKTFDAAPESNPFVKCSEEKDGKKMFIVVSKFIISYWKKVALSLGLSWNETYSIDAKSIPIQQKACRSLLLIEEVNINLSWLDIKRFIPPGDARKIEKEFQESDIYYDTDDIAVNNVPVLNNEVHFDAIVSNDMSFTLDNERVSFKYGNRRDVLTLDEWYSKGKEVSSSYVNRSCIACHAEENTKLLKSFKLFFENKKQSFVFSNYDLVKHYKDIGKEQKIRSYIDHIKVENFKFNHQYIACALDNNTLYFIQFSNERRSDQIRMDINRCVYSLHIFYTLYKNLLVKLNMKIIPIVVVREKDDTLRSHCRAVYVVTYDNFYHWGTDKMNVNEVDIFSSALMNQEKENQTNEEQKEEFSKLVGCILTYMEKFRCDFVSKLKKRNYRDFSIIKSKLKSITYQALLEEESGNDWNSVLDKLATKLLSDEDCRSKEAIQVFRKQHRFLDLQIT